MKTILVRRILLPLVVALTVVLCIGAAAWRPALAQTAPPGPAVPAVKALPFGPITISPKRDCSGNCFSIELGTGIDELRKMGSKDAADQLRDWAVYGTLAHLGVNKDAVGQATMQMAPVRLPYVEAAYRFDYGRGRRILFGNKVAFFYDSDDPDPKATLGRLADRVRMETGDQLDVPLVFSIQPDLAWGRILVRQKDQISAKDLFGSAYGYVESDVQSISDLDTWLKQVDDVTFASPVGNKLRVGGRHAFVKRTMNITVEDVAAIWKAQKDLADKHAARVALASAAFATPSPSLAKLLGNLMGGPQAPGFSLDPRWNPTGLAETLDAVATDPCSILPLAAEVLRKNPDPDETATPYIVVAAQALKPHGTVETRPQLAQVCRGTRALLEPALRRMAAEVRRAAREPQPDRRAQALDEAMLPLLQFRAPTTDEESEFLAAGVTKFINARYHMQCARYDGPLAGTNVGMTLFYADLLAKFMESVDYHASAPGMAVPGFISAPRQDVPATFQDDLKTKSSTRIWFAPNQLAAAQVAAGSNGPAKMFFEHIGTRIFAAGSDPTNPGKEEEPAEDARRTIGWWNRHYVDVADYEPRYHAQNQIIKWSLLTAWASAQLRFLEKQLVGDKLTFDVWLDRERAQLRYQHPVDLRPKQDWAVSGTECMDLLSSHRFSSYGSENRITGGVSLGGKAAVDEMNIVNASRPLWQRLSPPLEKAKTKVAWAPSKQSYVQGTVKITGATLRGHAVDSGKATLTTAFDVAPNKRVAISLSTDRGRVGTLYADSQLGSVRLGWTPGSQAQAIDAANSFVGLRRTATKRVPIKLQARYSTFLPTDDGVLHIQPSSQGKPLPQGVLARADAGYVSTVVTSKKSAELNKAINASKWQRLSVSEDGSQQLLSREFGSSPPPASAPRIELQNVPGFPKTLEVHLDSRGQYWIPRPLDDVGRATWRDVDIRGGLTADGLAGVRRAASRGATHIDYETIVPRRDQAVQKALDVTARGDLTAGRAVLKTFVADAEKSRSLATSAIVDADAALRRGDSRKAQDLYQLATDTGRAAPDVVLRRALSDIQAGRSAPGLQGLSGASQLSDELRQLVQHSPGLEDVSMVLGGHALANTKIFGESATSLGLSTRQGEVVSCLRLNGELPGKRLTPAQVKEYSKTADEAELYIDDGFSLNRQDFEASFDGSVAEFAHMPNVSWQEATATDHYYLPSHVDSKQGSYWRATAAGGGPRKAPDPATHAPARVRVLFIRNCDTDHDGILGQTEREAC